MVVLLCAFMYNSLSECFFFHDAKSSLSDVIRLATMFKTLQLFCIMLYNEKSDTKIILKHEKMEAKLLIFVIFM